MQTEFQKRDKILDELELVRADLLAEARVVAYELWQKNGKVSSTDILSVMRSDKKYSGKMEKVDPRFLGCVFRGVDGWVKKGYEFTGSHGRPVVVWEWSA